MNMGRAVAVTFFLLRVVTGLLFFQHGAQKLLGWFGGFGESGTARLMSLMGFAGVLELVGGILIMVGFLTQPVAFLVSGEMAVAYWMAHAPNAAWPIVNHGESPVLFCFIFLFMAAHGAGEWSVDAMMRRGRKVGGGAG